MNKLNKIFLSNKNSHKSASGITLIALVITIIVLLILAGITIASLTGSDSAPAKANEAKQKNDIGTAKDQLAILVQNEQTEAYDDIYVKGNNNVSLTNSTKTIGQRVITAALEQYATAKQIGDATMVVEQKATGQDAIVTITTRDYKETGTISATGGVLTWNGIGTVDELDGSSGTYTVTIITGNGIATATSSGNVKKGESMNLTATKADGITGDVFWKVTSGNFRDVNDTTLASTTVTPTANITIEASVITHNVYAATFEVGTEKVLVLNNNEWQSSDTYQGTTPSNIIGEYGDFSGYNSNTYNITKVDILNDIYPNSTENYFEGAGNLKTINNINKLHTDFVTSMDSMFLNCTSLTNIDVSNFNTRNVTNMHYMFCGISMNDLDITNFDTSNVTNMNQMFCGPADGCQIKTIYIGENWSVEKVVDDYSMFGYDGGILEGEKGTKASDYIDGNDGGCNDTTKTPKDYAHIDGGSTNPGFFTQGPAPISN